jgi:hypothetical protein
VDDFRRPTFWRLPASEDASRRGHPPDTQTTTRGSRVGPRYRRRGQFASCSLPLKFATNLASVGSSASISLSASHCKQFWIYLFPRKELAKTRSQISFINFQSHSAVGLWKNIIPKGTMKTWFKPGLPTMPSRKNLKLRLRDSNSGHLRQIY